MPEILEGGDGISQIDRDTLPNVAANAALHEKQADGGEAGGDQEHREEKARAQPQVRPKPVGLSRRRMRHGFGRRVHGDQRTNLYPMPCTVRKCTGLEGSFSNFWRSLRM